MNERAEELILNEIDERIEMESNDLEIEAVRALEEFKEWFLEMFVL